MEILNNKIRNTFIATIAVKIKNKHTKTARKERSAARFSNVIYPILNIRRVLAYHLIIDCVNNTYKKGTSRNYTNSRKYRNKQLKQTFSSITKRMREIDEQQSN